VAHARRQCLAEWAYAYAFPALLHGHCGIDLVLVVNEVHTPAEILAQPNSASFPCAAWQRIEESAHVWDGLSARFKVRKP